MQPIIHRRRDPLLPQDPPSQPLVAAPKPAAVPQSSASPTPLPVKNKNQTDSGQFSALPKPLPVGAEVTRLTPATSSNTIKPPSPTDPTFQLPNDSTLPPPPTDSTIQPCNDSTKHPPGSLWSRQPDEPAIDYQLFAAWLQLPVPRPDRKTAAKALGCSRYRLGRLFGRHRWKTRTMAFDNYRADAANRALDELLHQETKNLRERAELFRLQEWALHEKMAQAAYAALKEFRRRPRSCSLETLVQLLDLASILGRRACGLPLDPTQAVPEPPRLDSEWELALRKVYGGCLDPKTDAPLNNSPCQPTPA